MITVERFIIAALTGLAVGALVWIASDLLEAPRVWPGAIIAFSSTTIITLASTRARGGRSR